MKAKKHNPKYIILLLSAILSLGVNIVQLCIFQNNNSQSSDIAWRLKQYRELQNKQINAVEQNCNKVDDNWYASTRSGLGRFYNVINFYNSSLASFYAANINERCKTPVLIVAGYTDGNYKENANKIFNANTLKFDTDIFKKVKW